jgi:hypothetical protein
MVFILNGSGERTAESFEGDANGAALLHIEYTVQSTNSNPVVYITSHQDGEEVELTLGDYITFEADATDADGSISALRFYVDGQLIETDNSTPYSSSWSATGYGPHELKVVAKDNEGAETVETIFIEVKDESLTEFEVRITTGNDDAEEAESGALYLTSSDIELVYDSYQSSGNQTVGLRFNNISVPAEAVVRKAYIQFSVDETNDEVTNLLIQGEASPNPGTFTTATSDISSRQATSSNVNWTPQSWTAIGDIGSEQRTPDLTPIVQEIVNQGQWNSDQSMVFIITGTGVRTAESYEGSAPDAALLHISYETDLVTSANVASLDQVIEVYPTRTADQVWLNNKLHETYSYQVSNTQGHVFDQGKAAAGTSTAIQLRNLAPGLYIIRVHNGAEAKTYTVIKE